MDYIYDIVLNFHHNYYDFFEWKPTDKLINIKKILVYRVNDKDYLSLKYNDVILERSLLPKQIKVFLVTNGVEVMGILLDSEGKIIKRSSLLLDESDEILEDKDEIKQLTIKYKTNKLKQHSSESRIITEKSNYLKKYFSKLDLEKDEYLLKYIYYDIYNEEEENIKKVYKRLTELMKKDINKIYDSIKKVSIELKK